MNPEEFRELLESAVADRDEAALSRLETQAQQSPQTREIWREHLALEQALSVWSLQARSTAVDLNDRTTTPVTPLAAQASFPAPRPRAWVSLWRGGLLSLVLLLAWGVFVYGPIRQQQFSPTFAEQAFKAGGITGSPDETASPSPQELTPSAQPFADGENGRRTPKNPAALAASDSVWSRSLAWWQTESPAEQRPKSAVTFLPAWSRGLALGERSASMLDEEPYLLLPTTVALAESGGPLTPILLLPALPTMTEHLEQRVSATWETLTTLPQDMWQRWQGTWQADPQPPQAEPTPEQPENMEPQPEEPRDPPRRKLRRTRPSRTFSLDRHPHNPTYSV